MNIGIIESDQSIRETLVKEIETTTDHVVVLSAPSTEIFRKFHKPIKGITAIILGNHFQEASDLDSIQKLKKDNPKVIIIMHTQAADQKSILKALRAGANGYLLKSTIINWEKELHLVEKGSAPLSPTAAKCIFNYFNPSKFPLLKSKTNALTPKETLVLNHMIGGLSHKMIADQMGISVNGVYFHLKNIYKKLQVNSKVKVFKIYMKGFLIF